MTMCIIQAVALVKLPIDTSYNTVMLNAINWPWAEKCTQQHVALPFLTTKH